MTNITQPRTLVTYQRFYRALLLFSIILITYMLAYSARIQSGDTLRLFDGASSLARYGDTLRDETAWFIPPSNYAPSQPYPIEATEDSEPFAQQVLSWFYDLVDILPSIGFVHGLWTFNIFITAITAWLLYWLILLLNFRESTAFVVSLLFAVFTVVFPYSKTLFRESLTMFLLFSIFTTLLLVRRQVHWHWSFRLLGGIVTLLLFYVAYQTKQSSILAIPAMTLLLLPRKLFQIRYLSLGLLMIGCSLLWIFAYVPDAFLLLDRVLPNQIVGVSLSTDFAQVALHTYIFSVGGSVWGTSPIILLGILGCVYLWRADKQWVVWLVLTLIASYAIGHALLTSQFWFGGLSWPSRFMVPLLPFASLLIAPVIDQAIALFATQRAKSWVLWTGILSLMIYSAWVQYTAIVLPWGHYPDLLPADANGLIEWSGGLNELRYLRWVLLPQSLGRLGFDIAWMRAGVEYWVWIFAIIVVVLLAMSWRLSASLRPGRLWSLVPIFACFIIWLSLTDLYHTDPQYLAKESSLQDVSTILRQSARDSEPLFILDQLHSQYFMNYYEGVSPRPISLTIQPGEPADVPAGLLVQSNDINKLLDYRTIRQFNHVSHHFERFWFLTDISPFMTGGARIVEQYLMANFYLLQSYATSDPNVRLLLFDTTSPPVLTSFMNYDVSTDLIFDDSIQLSGITLPNTNTVTAGDSLPISLYWESLIPTTIDYTVALFLSPVDNNLPPIQGIDSSPNGGFSPTNNWQAGQIVWDHRALIIPQDLLPGTYRLWIVLYFNSTGGGIQRASITHGNSLDEDVGILPIEIMVVSSQ